VRACPASGSPPSREKRFSGGVADDSGFRRSPLVVLETQIAGFTKHYRLHRLVYVEEHESIVAAIQREKTIKHWPRV
jgi:predicted GIY-YIG superfamily endonuclease